MPAFAIGTFLETLPYVNEADIAHYREGLRTAGLPA
jgi:hypothetical protein